MPEDWLWPYSKRTVNLMSSHFTRKKVVYIQDLLNADFNFLSLAEFKENFLVQCPVTIYYGLINAVPKTWKSSLRNTTTPTDRFIPGAPTSTQHLSTKLAYSKLLVKGYLPPTVEPRIRNHGVTKEDILFCAGLTDFYTCPLCSLECQSLPHLLITCCESINFWDLFTHWWRITFHQNIVLSEKEILYCWLQNRSSINFIALNYSLIIAKYHIFTSSIRIGSLAFDSFLLRLKDKLSIIHSLAVKQTAWSI